MPYVAIYKLHDALPSSRFYKSEHLQKIKVFAYFTISKKCPYFSEEDNYYFHSNVDISISRYDAL